MEFPTAFYVILGVIGVIGFVGFVGNIQLANNYQRWLQTLSDYETRTSYDEGANQQELIQNMVSEYINHRSEGIEFVNTQAIVEKKLYQQEMNLLGIFRLPIGVVERVLQHLPSWSIIVGLLGTFSGLTLALFAMQGTLLQLGTDTGAEIMTVSTIVAAIAEPFRGMSFAFITSIAGIGMAFMLHVLHSGFFSKVGIGPSYTQLKNLFLTRAESFLDHQVQNAVQKEKPKDSLERVLDRLVEKVKQSFDESVKDFGQEIIRMVNQLEQNLGGIERVVEQSAQFTASFEQGTQQLTQFGKVLEANINKFKKHEEQVAGQMAQLSKNMTAVGQSFKQLTDKNDHTHQALERVIERSDQLTQQIIRKNEEMNQFYQQHLEEVGRRFQESMGEQQRQYQQNQDEWFYRYQEKNDQFSRAAESFGQAVNHLERQWDDGLERFKRDLSGQMNQLFDKYFSRQSHGGHQDREMRELIRELEMIQHLLEREFQSIHRFSQDTQHILVSIYEWGRTQMGAGGRYPQEARRSVHDEPVRSPVIRDSGY